MNKLGYYQKAQLSELVEVYINPSEYQVRNNGGITVDKTNWFKRLFNIRNEKDMEFLEVVQVLSDKIIEKKQNESTLNLCTNAMHVLVSTNDRGEVVRLIYLAHIMDEKDLSLVKQRIILQPQKQEQKKSQKQIANVEIVQETRVKPAKLEVYTDRGNQCLPARMPNVVDMMNNADQIIVVSED